MNATGENEPLVLNTFCDSILLPQGILREVTDNEKGKLRGGRALMADDDSDDGDDDGNDDDSGDDSDNDSPMDSSLVEQTRNLLPALPPTAIAKAQPL